ncbi:MAG: hypothetical protein ACRDQU_05300 [Pseudonocardiaceae bacterium]
MAAVASSLVAVAGSGVASADPVTVHVDAVRAPTSASAKHVPPVDSGVYLRPGQWAVIAVSGTATCTPDSNHAKSLHCLNADANGSPDIAGSDFLAPGLRKFSLVGKVGNGPLMFVGGGPPGGWALAADNVTGPGPLRLGYNDEFKYYADNTGGFDVNIEIYEKCLGDQICGPL